MDNRLTGSRHRVHLLGFAEPCARRRAHELCERHQLLQHSRSRGRLRRRLENDSRDGSAGTTYSASATAYDPAIRAAKTIDDIVCAGTSGIPVEWCPNVNGSNTPATVTVTDALGRPLTVNTPRGTSRFECRRAHEFIVEAASRQYHGADIVWAQNAKGDLTRSAFDGDRVLAVDECSNSNATRTMPSSSGRTDLHRTLYGWPFFVHRQ